MRDSHKVHLKREGEKKKRGEKIDQRKREREERIYTVIQDMQKRETGR